MKLFNYETATVFDEKKALSSINMKYGDKFIIDPVKYTLEEVYNLVEYGLYVINFENNEIWLCKMPIETSISI